MFSKSGKKGYLVFVLVLAALMGGGYFLGTLIGNRVLDDSIGKKRRNLDTKLFVQWTGIIWTRRTMRCRL